MQEIRGYPILREPAPDPCAFVIFGAAGDLTRRKLIPALYNLACAGSLPPSIAIIGVSRKHISAEAFRDDLLEATSQFSRRQPIDHTIWQRLMANFHYVEGGLESATTCALAHDYL